jgi:hypothetical protein
MSRAFSAKRHFFLFLGLRPGYREARLRRSKPSPITNHQSLLTAYCLLLTAYCLLLTAYCLLPYQLHRALKLRGFLFNPEICRI